MSPSVGLVSLFGLDPATYQSHSLHAPARTYAETNCYSDILIELLHARGDEPLAMMGCTLRIDFEGDQWTFLKPFPEDLELLFGVDVHEMQPYRSLPLQIAEQLEQGRTLIVELDSFYLPDTVATSYRREHVKSSVVAEAIDPAAERLHYFHATGLHALQGEDFRAVFRLGEPPSGVLPPYTELVRFDAGPRLRGEPLRSAARERLRHHLRRRPSDNPFSRFGRQLEEALPGLLAGDSADYHAYAFATVRMVGSASEVAASYVQWLLGADGRAAVESLQRIVEICKTLSLKLARQRPFDPRPLLDELATCWARAIASLEAVAA